MTRIALIIAGVLIALALTACGESAEDNTPENAQANAQKTVCDARDDISNQVNSLKGITRETFSKDAVSKSASAIQRDLSAIKGAEPDLSDDLRQQVQSANQAFETQVEGIVKQIGASTTAAEAASTIEAAGQELASSYEQTFARIDCG